MPLILHRLLCWFSVHDPLRAQACFGPLAEFTGSPARKASQHGGGWKHFPHTSPFAQLLYARIHAIWDLWQDYGNPAVPLLAYYTGIVLDAHLILCLPNGPHSLVECYVQGRAPEQNTALAGIWCHVHHHRLFEQLWHTELDSSFLTPPPSPTEKMLAILKKGLPKPTSIRYIGAQLHKGLQSSEKLVLEILYGGLLGAYPHTTTIAPPHRRWSLYSAFSAETYIAQAPPIELYALVAEHVIAGSEAHRPIAYLLRRTQFWDAHRKTILQAMKAFRTGKPVEKNILGGGTSKPYHPFETHTSKNLLFYLFKYVGIRKRLPRAVLAVLPKNTLVSAYKFALTNIVSFGIRLDVLRAMGCSRRGCTFLKKSLFQSPSGTP